MGTLPQAESAVIARSNERARTDAPSTKKRAVRLQCEALRMRRRKNFEGGVSCIVCTMHEVQSKPLCLHRRWWLKCQSDPKERIW